MNRRWADRYAREKKDARPRAPHRDRTAELRAVRFHIGELLNGRVYVRRWTLDHVTCYGTLLFELGSGLGYFWPRHNWMVVLRPEIHLEEQVMIPDLAGWRASRRVQPDREPPWCDQSCGRFSQKPDWVCDIVEPSHVGLVRNVKLPLYYRLGIGHLWHVNRIESTLQVYTAGDSSWCLVGTFGGNGWLRAAPFKHVEVRLDGLWDSCS